MENKFVFVAPAYNAEKTVKQTILSLAAQSYSNWQLVIIDDLSTDNTVRTIDELSNSLLLSRKIKVICNEEKKWEVANVLSGIALAGDTDIICRIDCDDWLTDTDALHIINARYNQLGCDALWTAHRWSFTDQNISGPMPQGVDVYKHPWVSSHLKTFRKYLLNNVKDENYRGSDGNYIRRAGDQAIYLPCLHNAKKWWFEPRVMYHYTINLVPETFNTPDSFFQRNEAIFLRQRGYVK